ncbi:MAG: TonB-dependent receptor [Bacteroidia bacterium]
MLKSDHSISPFILFRLWIFCGLLCLFTKSVFGQDTAELRPLLVSATVHQNRIELSSKNIRQINPNLKLSQQLQYQSGMFVKSQGEGSLSTISYKGLGASHINVSIENTSFLSSMNGGMDLNNIHSFHFNQSSIEEGNPSTTLNRANLGPQIQLQSDLNNRFEIYSSLDQLTNKTLGFAYGKTMERDAFQISFLSQHSNNKISLSHYEVDEQLSNTGYQDYSLFAKARKQLGNSITWIPVLYLQYADRRIPSSLVAKDDGTQKDINALMVNRFIVALDANWSLNVQQQLWKENIEYNSELRDIEANNEVLNSNSAVSLVNSSKKHKWSLGINHDYSDYSASNLAQGQVIWNRIRFNSSYSLRFKNSTFAISVQTQNYDSKLMSQLDLSYDLLLKKSRLLTIELKKSYRLPHLNELYWFEPGFANGNPNLEAEQSYRAEIYYHDIFGSVGVRINPFIGYYTQLIAWSGYPEITTVNLARVLSRGLDLHLNWIHKTSQGQWLIQHNQHWVQSTYHSKEDPVHPFGKQLIYTPILSTNLQLSYSQNSWGILINQHYVSANYYTSDNSALIDPYALTDFGGYWQLDHLRVGAQIHNILNEAYFTVLNRAMAGRYASINLSYHIKQQPINKNK